MAIATLDPRVTQMAREHKKGEDKQVVFRLSGDLHARLKQTAEGLELDISSLLRMMAREYLPVYEARADEIRRREQKAGQ